VKSRLWSLRHAALALPSQNPLNNHAQGLRHAEKRRGRRTWETRSLDPPLRWDVLSDLVYTCDRAGGVFSHVPSWKATLVPRWQENEAWYAITRGNKLDRLGEGQESVRHVMGRRPARTCRPPERTLGGRAWAQAAPSRGPWMCIAWRHSSAHKGSPQPAVECLEHPSRLSAFWLITQEAVCDQMRG